MRWTVTRHFPRPRPGAHAVPFHSSQPRNPFRRRAADGAHDVSFLADGPVAIHRRIAWLDVPDLAAGVVVFVLLKVYAY